MRVLLIGSGGREHALAWKLAQSRHLSALFCAPGNPGIGTLAEIVPLDPGNHAAITGFCRSERIDLVAIGPEAPLAAGLADDLRQRDIPVFGPSRAAALLESSKSFTKALCVENDIPTAAHAVFADAEAARHYVRKAGAPLVVKADGLAAGKGVTICSTVGAALEAVDYCFSGALGPAGGSVVIEEKLEGEELSFFAICDGERALPLASAQDYKRAFEGDRGPNTGGMGAVSPAPLMTAGLGEQIMDRIVKPTLAAMAERGTPFQGVLYAGLMSTAQGVKLIEYNVRFGDPECQALMLRLKSDLLPLLASAASGKLSLDPIEWAESASVVTVLAAKGYPGPVDKGSAIEGIDRAAKRPGVTVFHAGTAAGPGGEILANGGRVLNICATGPSVSEAQAACLQAIGEIGWPGGFWRRDIGWRSIAREVAHGGRAR